MSQYEALKYVSFPTQVVARPCRMDPTPTPTPTPNPNPSPAPTPNQVVAKSCKMVPVMLMGYLVSRKRYTALEYGMAVAITSGAAIFKLNEEADPEQDGP